MLAHSQAHPLNTSPHLHVGQVPLQLHDQLIQCSQLLRQQPLLEVRVTWQASQGAVGASVLQSRQTGEDVRDGAQQGQRLILRKGWSWGQRAAACGGGSSGGWQQPAEACAPSPAASRFYPPGIPAATTSASLRHPLASTAAAASPASRLKPWRDLG